MSATIEIAVEPEQRRLARPVRRLLKAVMSAENRAGTVAVAFVDETKMAELNERFRGDAGTTDVLSFGREDDQEGWPDPSGQETVDLGELVLCLQVIDRYGLETGGDPDAQLGWTLIHGALHLLGYDHEKDGGEMRTREQALLRELHPQVQAVGKAVRR